jgi:hypothetical protein
MDESLKLANLLARQEAREKAGTEQLYTGTYRFSSRSRTERLRVLNEKWGGKERAPVARYQELAVTEEVEAPGVAAANSLPGPIAGTG